MEVDERSLKRRGAAQASRDEKRQRMGDEAYKQMRADEEKERRRRQKKAAEEAAEQLEEAAAAEAVRKEQQEAEMAALRDKCAAATEEAEAARKRGLRNPGAVAGPSAGVWRPRFASWRAKGTPGLCVGSTHGWAGTVDRGSVWSGGARPTT